MSRLAWLPPTIKAVCCALAPSFVAAVILLHVVRLP